MLCPETSSERANLLGSVPTPNDFPFPWGCFSSSLAKLFIWFFFTTWLVVFSLTHWGCFQATMNATHFLLPSVSHGGWGPSGWNQLTTLCTPAPTIWLAVIHSSGPNSGITPTHSWIKTSYAPKAGYVSQLPVISLTSDTGFPTLALPRSCRFLVLTASLERSRVRSWIQDICWCRVPPTSTLRLSFLFLPRVPDARRTSFKASMAKCF